MSSSRYFRQDPWADEIAICDVGIFQVLIPTEKQWLKKRRNGGLNLPRRRRVYSDSGWVCYQRRIIGGLSGLRLHSVLPSSEFQVSPRITIGCPFSFEMHSQLPIPAAIAERASLLYQFNPAPMLHYALLQNLIPQFVRIYPFRSSASLEKLALKFLQEEKATLGF